MLITTRPMMLACLFGTSSLLVPSAQALDFTRGDITYYDFFSRYGDLPETEQVFGSYARDHARRTGFIKNSDDEQESVETEDPMPGDPDFHGVRSTIPGDTVGMRSSLSDSLELPSSNPARAKTTKFSNHVFATTSRSLEFSNHLNTGESNDNFDPTDDYWVRTGKTATASSQWEDSWLATQSEHVSLDFALEGSISVNQGCFAAGTCGVILPAGTEFHRTEDFHFDLRAAMVVYDLSTIVPCEQVSDECDGEGAAPLALDSITVRGGIYSTSRSADYAVLDAGGTLDVDIVDTLEFDAIAGHQYYVLSLLSVESQNGVRLDFFNSFKLTGVNASPGNLLSSALGDQDITSHFSAVPVPGALWMMLGGLGALGLRGARHKLSATA